MIAFASWQYIILNGSSATGYRVKRRTNGPPPVSSSGFENPDADFWSKTAPATISFGGGTYYFAFWSITSEDVLSPQREAHVESGTTANSSHIGAANQGGGQWVVTAKAYYIPRFGGGTIGGPGGFVLIDAFDIQLGDFVPDDFVTVTPDDKNKTLTAAANNGFIDTMAMINPGNPITIAATDVLSTQKKFGSWQSVQSFFYSANPAMPAQVGAPDIHDLVVNNGDTVVAFAFYNELPYSIRIPKRYEIYNRWWWIETHGGLTPGPNPDPWTREIETAVLLSNTANLVSPELRRGVLELALKQLALAGRNLEGQIKTFQV